MSARLTKTDILRTLERLKPDLREQCHVQRIALFGSYAREGHTDISDIDILVEFDEDADLYDYVRLGQLLEDVFQREVDIVTPDALKPEIRDAVLREAVPT